MISFWKKKSFISFLLSPLSLIYLLISKLNGFFARPKRFGKKIICIGNITAGGAGKTPAAIAIAKEMHKKNIKVAFAVRNYKSDSTKEFHLTVKDKYQQDIVEEAFLLSQIAPTYVASKRLRAVELACESDAQYVIVDDGLQNHSFEKDIKIVVMDGVQKFGNGMLIPAGPLREMKSSIKKTDVIVKVNYEEKEQDDADYAKGSIMFPKNFDVNMPYIAFAGIGCPEKFFKSLKEKKIKMLREINFPDHHIYSDADIANLIKIAKKYNAKLITTRKDAIKLGKLENLIVVDYKIIFENSNKVMELILNAPDK